MLKFDGGLLRGAKVVIDGSGDREFRQELGAYLRQHCGKGAIKHVRFADSSNDRLIQLADMCAGAIARSYKRCDLYEDIAIDLGGQDRLSEGQRQLIRRAAMLRRTARGHGGTRVSTLSFMG